MKKNTSPPTNFFFKIYFAHFYLFIPALFDYHRFFEFIRFDTSDEVGVAEVEGVHEGLQGLLELRGQGRRTLPKQI